MFSLQESYFFFCKIIFGLSKFLILHNLIKQKQKTIKKLFVLLKQLQNQLKFE